MVAISEVYVRLDTSTSRIGRTRSAAAVLGGMAVLWSLAGMDQRALASGCAPDATLVHPPHLPNDEWFADNSDLDGFQIDFESVDDGLLEPITSVRVWGLYSRFTEGLAQESCVQPHLPIPDVTLRVQFYSGGVFPDAVLCEHTLTVTPQLTGEVYFRPASILDGIMFDLELPTPCDGTATWVTVHGPADMESCQFYWLSSSVGDNKVVFLDLDGQGVFRTANGDLALCIHRRTPCPGDATNDLSINVADFIAVLLNFGATGTPGIQPGDANADGVVNVDDFIVVLLNFGTEC